MSPRGSVNVLLSSYQPWPRIAGGNPDLARVGREKATGSSWRSSWRSSKSRSKAARKQPYWEGNAEKKEDKRERSGRTKDCTIRKTDLPVKKWKRALQASVFRRCAVCVAQRSIKAYKALQSLHSTKKVCRRKHDRTVLHTCTDCVCDGILFLHILLRRCIFFNT